MIFNALILSVLLFSGNPFTVDAAPETEHNLSFPLGRNWQCVISPGPDLYPRYIADRLGVEYRDGRSVMGEFFQHHETYVAFGLWIEL